MDKFVIEGGKPLHGCIDVSGMKNAAVAIIFGTILTEGKCVLENIPMISDVNDSFEILTQVGAVIKQIDKSTFEIDTTNIKPGIAPYDLVKKMRASYYILGAELGRFGKARAAYPGGCEIGARPIDQHIKGFESLGAKVEIQNGGYINITTPEGALYANSVYMDIVSVGATINVILAAVKAQGTTIIENAAREPHVVDLANFLNASGADISGAGTDVIKIRGVEELHGVHYEIIPDMIEAGTYMIAAAATKGELMINNVIPKHLESLSSKLIEMGIEVEEFDNSVRVAYKGPFDGIKIKTLPYPGFPTDMNPQMGVLMCMASTESTMREGVWDNRFKYVDELLRMGASIKVTDGKMAQFDGGAKLFGAPVTACDLRAGAALIIAGLAATGITEIDNIRHIQRGYEDIVGKLKEVGANIKLVSEN